MLKISGIWLTGISSRRTSRKDFYCFLGVAFCILDADIYQSLDCGTPTGDGWHFLFPKFKFLVPGLLTVCRLHSDAYGAIRCAIDALRIHLTALSTLNRHYHFPYFIGSTVDDDETVLIRLVPKNATSSRSKNGRNRGCGTWQCLLIPVP